jgi:protein-disulfide isomerase
VEGNGRRGWEPNFGRLKLKDTEIIEMARQSDTPIRYYYDDNGLTEKNLALFKKNNFQGTPAIVFENGMTLKGFAENPRLEEMLAKK